MALTLHPQTVADQLGLTADDDSRYFMGSVNLDSAYPTGGYPLTSGISNIFGMSVIGDVLCSPTVVGGVTIVPEVVFVNSAPANLRFRNAATNAEVANATNLSTGTVQMIVQGF